MENLFLDLSGKFSFSVSPQIFRNSSVRKTEKLKNRIHRENLFLDLSGKFSFQLFCFSVFQFWFRNYSGNFP